MQSAPRAVIWLAAAMLLLSTAFAATANAQSDSLVLVDDMEDPAVGLLSEVSANPDLSAFTYFDGRYFIQTLQEGTAGDIFSFLTTNPVSDTLMTIDLAIGGDQTGKYGLIGCRAGIDNAGYQFSLEPAAGVAALWRIDPAGAVKLGEADVADLVVPAPASTPSASVVKAMSSLRQSMARSSFPRTTTPTRAVSPISAPAPTKALLIRSSPRSTI